MFTKFKKLVSKLEFNCIASFIGGAYSFFLINYFWFDRSITPAGVSASISAMALAFTIFAASKVLKWYEDKKNSQAFLHTEKIIDSLSVYYINLGNTYIELATYYTHYDSNDNAKNKIREKEIGIKFDTLNENDITFHKLFITRNIWGVKFEEELANRIISISEKILKYQFRFYSAIHKQEYNKKIALDELTKAMNTTLIEFQKLLQVEYNDWFYFDNKKAR